MTALAVLPPRDHVAVDGLSKRRYRTKHAAKRSRLSLMAHGGDRLVIYRCCWCGGWHLGHGR